MNITVLGTGGHGWESLEHFIQSTPRATINCYCLTTDWGGFTGTWGRLLEWNNNKLNILLHGHNQPVLPWGDFNKIISHFICETYGASVQEAFDSRSDSLSELLTNFSVISTNLALDPDLTFSFSHYLTTALDFLAKHQQELGFVGRKPSLAHFWNTFIFYKTGSMEGFNDFYKKRNVLPPHLNLHFTSTERKILTGRTQHGYLEGEEYLDEAQEPVLPESFSIRNINNSDNTDSHLSLAIMQSDYIIIPNGSIANWLPLFNNPYYRIDLQTKSNQKKVFILMNLFHTQNECEFSKYIYYLNSININPVIIGPKIKHLNPDPDLLNAYQKEGKTLNSLAEIDNFNNYFASIDIISHQVNPETIGVKYDTASVTLALKTFINV